MMLKYIVPSEIIQFEKAMYSMIPTIWHSRKGKINETIKKPLVQGVQGEREKTIHYWSRRDFQGSKTIPQDIAMVDTCYIFVQNRKKNKQTQIWNVQHKD